MVPAQWLVAAMSLVNSLSITVQAVIAYRVLAKRIGAFHGLRLAPAAFAMIAASGAASAVGILVLNLMGGWVYNGYALSSVLSALSTCVVVGIVMLTVYALALKFLKVREADTALRAIRGIIRR